MTDIGGMVETLIAAGTPPALAAQIVTQAFAAGINSANSTGIPVDRVAEKRRAYDRERRRNSTGIPPDSTGIPNSLIIEDTKKVSIKRGSRLPPEWTLPPEGREFAKQRGWSEAQIDNEVGNFRDYWVSKPGAGGCKLDWLLTWQSWIRNSKVKPAGDTALPSPSGPKLSPDDAVAQFVKFSRWSRYSPFNDISQVPVELLTKHGLLPDGRKIASQGIT